MEGQTMTKLSTQLIADAGYDGTEWRKDAKCRTKAALLWLAEQFEVALADVPDVWFPSKGGNSVARVGAARAICRGEDGNPPCPVMLICREHAMEENERFGVWGGMSEQERTGLRRTRRRMAKDRGKILVRR